MTPDKRVEEIVEAIFKDSDTIIAIETKTETEFLHKTYPAHITVSLEGDVIIYRDVPAKYATSTTVSEGAIDSREITVVEKKYSQSDVVKILLTQYHQDCMKEVVESIKKEVITEMTWYRIDEGVDEIERGVNYIKLSELYEALNHYQI